MLLEKGKVRACCRLAPIVGLFLVVPAVLKLREQRRQKHHRHFPIFGH